MFLTDVSFGYLPAKQAAAAGTVVVAWRPWAVPA
jgi:hypothetical protein